MTTLLLNTFRAVSVRLLIPWTGAWIADVDFDLEAVPVAPTGAALLKIGETTVLLGTIDPRASGRFGQKGRARVVAGAGGWDKTVTARHFHNDAGLLSAAVLTATAAEVGEKLVQPIPSVLGFDFVRSAGPASRVLAGLDWYVDFSGVTFVGPRVPIPADPTSVEVLSFDPNTQRAEIASDAVIRPGTILVDPRFGTATVRDVEQTFNDAGARATAWCGETSTSRFISGLKSLAREATGLAHLKGYKYRVVAAGPDGRLTLQALRRAAGVPDSIAIPVWPGVAGVSVQVAPGTICIVEFVEGDPAQPVVRAFEPGATIVMAKVGTGLSPVVLYAQLAIYLAALEAKLAASVVGPVPTPFAAMGAASTKLLTD